MRRTEFRMLQLLPGAKMYARGVHTNHTSRDSLVGTDFFFCYRQHRQRRRRFVFVLVNAKRFTYK